MELVKPSFSSRWVQPLPNTHPEVEVCFRRLPDAESARIADRVGYVAGSHKATAIKQQSYLKETIKATIVDWKGFTIDGAEAPCTEKNKLDLIEQVVVDEESGEEKSLYVLVAELASKAEEEERKNSQGSSNGDTPTTARNKS